MVAYTVKFMISGPRHSPLGPLLGTCRFWGQVAVANPHPRSPGPDKVTTPNSDPLQTLLWPWNLHREAQVLGTHCTKCPGPPLHPLGSGLDSWNWCTPAGGSYGMTLLWGNKWLESRGADSHPGAPSPWVWPSATLRSRLTQTLQENYRPMSPMNIAISILKKMLAQLKLLSKIQGWFHLWK